jgi:hypothetical protein
MVTWVEAPAWVDLAPILQQLVRVLHHVTMHDNALDVARVTRAAHVGGIWVDAVADLLTAGGLEYAVPTNGESAATDWWARVSTWRWSPWWLTKLGEEFILFGNGSVQTICIISAGIEATEGRFTTVAEAIAVVVAVIPEDFCMNMRKVFVSIPRVA